MLFSAPSRNILLLMFGSGVKTRTMYLAFGLLSLLLCAAPAGAQDRGGDWGVTLDSNATLRLTDNWDERSTAYVFTSAFWTRYFIPTATPRVLARGATPGSSGTEFASQLSYTWTDERPYLFDVDLLRLHGTYPGIVGRNAQLQTTLGRFRFTEATGAIFNHTADGAALRLTANRLRMELASGYTGLLLNPSSSIRMSAADSFETDDDDTFLGPARAFGMFSIGIPQLVGRQTVQLSVVGQRDLRELVHGAEDTEDIVHSGYYSVRADGPLVPNLFYDVFLILSTGTQELAGEVENTRGLLASARVRLFRQDLAFSRAAFRVAYASGKDDNFDPYTPIVRLVPGTVVALPLQNMILGELSYSLRPFSGSPSQAARNIQTGMSARSFFTATDQVPATSGVKLQDPGRWIGNEIVLNLSGRLFMDLGFSLSGGVFIPETGSFGVFSGERRTEFYAKAEISSAL